MSNPLFSIIVPVYNAQQYIRTCIDSLVNQTIPDLEIILVNDGSRDASGLICDEYAARDVRIKVHHKNNGGVSSARNIGLNISKGDWICFADSDDSVDPYWLEEYARALNNTDIIFQGAVLVDNGIGEKITLREYFVQGDAREKVLSYLEDVPGSLLNSTWSKCYKSSIIRENSIQFMEKCSLNEDLIFTLQFLIVSSSLKVIKHAGYNYRRDNSTLTRMKHEPTKLLHWKTSIFKPLTILCAGNKNSPLYRSVATKEFSYISYYMICNVRDMEKNIKENYYGFLRSLKEFVNKKSLPANRFIFLFSFLPLSFFDVLLIKYSSAYLWLKSFTGRNYPQSPLQQPYLQGVKKGSLN